MQAVESIVRNNTTPSGRTNSAARCFLAQSEVGAVIVIVADVAGKKSLQVMLVQSDGSLLILLFHSWLITQTLKPSIQRGKTQVF